jgi:hypothetical protein
MPGKNSQPKVSAQSTVSAQHKPHLTNAERARENRKFVEGWTNRGGVNSKAKSEARPNKWGKSGGSRKKRRTRKYK